MLHLWQSFDKNITNIFQHSPPKFIKRIFSRDCLSYWNSHHILSTLYKSVDPNVSLIHLIWFVTGLNSSDLLCTYQQCSVVQQRNQPSYILVWATIVPNNVQISLYCIFTLCSLNLKRSKGLQLRILDLAAWRSHHNKASNGFLKHSQQF